MMVDVGDMMMVNHFTDEEYLVFVANLLIGFGKAGIESRNEYADINIENSNSIELALNQNPNDVHLASLLQGHILIKWSESLKTGE